jgi:structural maintenance of chromosome 1
LAESVPTYEHSKLALDQLEANIKKIEQEIAQVEDHIFEDFCAHINVANIREYEAMQFGVSAEVTERRTQFSTQKTRLETQLTFENSQLNELVERLRKLETTLANDTKSKSQLETDLAGMAGESENLKFQRESYKADLEKQIELEEAKQRDINEISRSLEEKGKDVEAILRECRAAESECNKVHAERIAIFRKCKLEGINLPLKRGSMDDIIIEDSRANNANANGGYNSDTGSVSDSSSVASAPQPMELDAPSQGSIQSTDWAVEVDYDQVGANQRSDDSQSMDREFQDKIKELGDEVEQMAPNLKAIDKLESVAEKLKIVEQEFNSARATAKTAKEEFNAIKKKR